MNPSLLVYGSLAAAIVLEVIGTTFLQKSEQFSKLVPTAAMVLFYVASFYLLSQALKGLPLGIAYAMWSGLGIVLTAERLSGWLQRNTKVLRGIDYTFAGVFSLFAVKILMTQTK